MKFSIIIPVYNLERYIEDCLKSCLNQTLDEYEIICVDDGSKDGSARILDEFELKYPERIKVIHKANGGVSSARNEGIAHACGRWIWFVDGDDCIKPDCLNGLFNKLEQQRCDIMAIQDTMFEEGLGFEQIMNISSKSKNVDNIECIAFKIFKREIIEKHSIRFDETLSHGEDNIFIYQFMKHISSYHVDTEVVYYYRKRMNSASRSRNAENKKRLYTSQLRQVLFYDDEIRGYSCGGYFSLEDIEYRRELFLKRALITMCLFETEKAQVKRVLDKLSERGLYPVRFTTEIRGSLKERVYRFIQDKLGNRVFFNLMWNLNRVVKTVRR